MMRSLSIATLFLLPCITSCQQAYEPFFADSTQSMGQDSVRSQSPTAHAIFQSADAGQTWQDISEGLPDGFTPNIIFTDKDEVFLSAVQGIYRKTHHSNRINWAKEMFLEAPINAFSAGRTDMIAYDTNGRFFKKVNGTDVWMPVFTDFQGSSVRTVFTARDGSVFIGCDSGIFKSADQGKTWKHVMQHGWAIHMAEANGVLLCTNTRGILRSTDGGEHWDVVLSEGGVGIAVESIQGGFAAITYNAESKSRRIRTSTDGGKTWEAIDAGLPPSQLISSIQQVGNSFYCGHPKGVYRSDDRGKTWKLILPGVEGKVFNLSVCGEVVYAVLRDGGC